MSQRKAVEEDDEFGWFMSNDEPEPAVCEDVFTPQQNLPVAVVDQTMSLEVGQLEVGRLEVGRLGETWVAGLYHPPEARAGGSFEDSDELAVWGAEATVSLIQPSPVSHLIQPSPVSHLNALLRCSARPEVAPLVDIDQEKQEEQSIVVAAGVPGPPALIEAVSDCGQGLSEDDSSEGDGCDWFFGGRAAREEEEAGVVSLSSGGIIPRDVLLALGRVLESLLRTSCGHEWRIRHSSGCQLVLEAGTSLHTIE